MTFFQKRLISTTVKMLMDERPNFATNQPNYLSNLNKVSAQPLQQSKEWHASVTPNNRNNLVHTM